MAGSLGWAIGCGCLKHDLAADPESLLILLPGCRAVDIETLANDVANGKKRSIDHEEYNFLCMIICNSTDWGSVNEVVGRNYESPI